MKTAVHVCYLLLVLIVARFAATCGLLATFAPVQVSFVFAVGLVLVDVSRKSLGYCSISSVVRHDGAGVRVRVHGGRGGGGVQVTFLIVTTLCCDCHCRSCCQPSHANCTQLMSGALTSLVGVSC